MFRWRQFKSAEVRRRHQRLFMWEMVCWLVVVVLVCAVLAGLSSLSQFRWKEVRVDGAVIVDVRDVYNVVMPYLSGRVFGIFDRDNRLVLANGKVESELREVFPAIQSVEVRDDNGVLVVAIVEREAVAAACEIGGITDCYLVDANGYQFAPAELIGGLFVYHTEPELRSYVRPREEFRYFSDMRSELEKLGLHARSLTLLDDEMALAVHGGTKVRFGLDDHERQFENLATILESEEYQAETDGVIARVEYFDLRFGDRVFYKLVGE